MDLHQIKKAHVIIFGIIVLLPVLVIISPQYQGKILQSREPYPKEVIHEGYNTKRTMKHGNVKRTILKNGLNGIRNKTLTSSIDKCVKRLPKAIVVGIQKCGTTALLKFLGVHPQIAAYGSEAQYFYGKRYETHSLDWYRKLMPCSYSNQITMEKSPPYFYRREAAKNIKEMNPKIKIIIIVKDPITRAVSMYAMLKEYNKVEGKTFEESVTLDDNKTIDVSSRFVEFSHYPKHMQAWLDFFKRSQILILDGHNMEQDPSNELNKVENFLGIKNYFTPKMFAFNSVKKKYCLNINSSAELDCLNEKKGRKHPDIDKNIIKSLQTYFKPLNKKFFSMIGKSFNWSYWQ